MPDALIDVDVDVDDLLADEIAADDAHDRYLLEQEQADRVAEWEAALRFKSLVSRSLPPCAPVVQVYRRPRERRARRVVRTSGSRGDPSPEPPHELLEA